jgi:hypothetical protein
MTSTSRSRVAVLLQLAAVVAPVTSVTEIVATSEFTTLSLDTVHEHAPGNDPRQRAGIVVVVLLVDVVAVIVLEVDVTVVVVLLSGARGSRYSNTGTMCPSSRLRKNAL